MKPHLTLEPFRAGQILKDQWEEVDRVYFPTYGLVSARAILASGHQIECSLIGRTNAVGVVATIGFHSALTRYVCLTDGHAWSIPLPRLLAAMRASAAVERELKVFSFAQMGYAVHGGVCNAMHGAEQRVSRWLTTAADLLGQPEVRLSQEELASGLGLQRTALNPTLQRLKADGLVEVSRGRIVIREADQLRQRACECSHTLRRSLFLEVSDRYALD